MASKVYRGDIGTAIILDTRSPIDGATKASIKFKRPQGTSGEWVGGVYEGTKIKYIIEDGDLDTAGIWFLQAYVETPAWKGRGETVRLVVFNDFE